MPWLRGTISYQAPARARGRSTIDRNGDAAGQVAARVACSDRLGEVVRQQGFDIRDAVELPPGPVDDPLDVRIANIQLAEKFTAFLGLNSENMARLAVEQHSFAPCRELVGPGFDRKKVAARLRRGELAMPAVVSGQEHRFAPPVGLGFLPPQQFCGQLIVPFAEQIGPYFNGFAGNALERIAAAVDAGIDVLD